MSLLAFPRGRSNATFNEGERLRSVESRRRWTLTVDGARARRYDLQASLGTLERSFVPRRVTANGRALPRGAWSFDRRTRVLTATFTGRRVTLRADGRRSGVPRPPGPPVDRAPGRPDPRFTG